jgi:ATP-dependent Clp endopeptidase proteolytic subunit ClpP|nr:MAG TPA: Putative ATP dependent Clp protease [Caudoviricetes sp.]
MKTVNINGDIICTDMKWIYDWLEYESCCPADVKNVITELKDESEELKVIINSPGGDVQAGQEIYSVLKDVKNHVTIEVQSMAASAASMIAMAGDTVRMSPVSLLMIHNASTRAAGDYRDMQHTAEVLQTVNAAIMQAYIAKTGKTEDELKVMMDKETWLTANQCLEYGFADEIIKDETPAVITNAMIGRLSVTPEMIAKVKAEKAAAEAAADEKNRANAEAKELLKASMLSKLKNYGK